MMSFSDSLVEKNESWPSPKTEINSRCERKTVIEMPTYVQQEFLAPC